MSIFCSKGWPSFQKMPNFLKLSPGQWSATGHSTDHWAALFWRGGCDCCSRAGGRPHGDGLGILAARGDTGDLPCAYQASSRSLLTVKVGLPGRHGSDIASNQCLGPRGISKLILGTSVWHHFQSTLWIPLAIKHSYGKLPIYEMIYCTYKNNDFPLRR